VDQVRREHRFGGCGTELADLTLDPDGTRSIATRRRVESLQIGQERKRAPWMPTNENWFAKSPINAAISLRVAVRR